MSGKQEPWNKASQDGGRGRKKSDEFPALGKENADRFAGNHRPSIVMRVDQEYVDGCENNKTPPPRAFCVQIIDERAIGTETEQKQQAVHSDVLGVKYLVGIERQKRESQIHLPGTQAD